MRRRWRRLALPLLVLLAVPTPARADGGAPLLLLVSPVVFLAGQVWIIFAEAVVLRLVTQGVGWRDLLRDVVAANLKSFMVVGLFLPAAVSVGGWLLGAALGLGLHALGFERAAAVVGSFFILGAGWIGDFPILRKTLPYTLAWWFTVSFYLSARVEAAVLRRRWEARRAEPAIAPMRASWIANAASYAGLAGVLLWAAISRNWFGRP